MFQSGDLIVYGNNGVCEVTDVTELENSQGRLYYILKNRLTNGIAYVPVDSGVFMRAIMTESEAHSFIKTIPTLKTDMFKNVGVRDAQRVYREALHTYDPGKIICLIKHIIESGENKKSVGKKLTTTEERFLEQAKRVIESELSVSLNMDISEVSSYITNCVNKEK